MPPFIASSLSNDCPLTPSMSVSTQNMLISIAGKVAVSDESVAMIISPKARSSNALVLSITSLASGRQLGDVGGVVNALDDRRSVGDAIMSRGEAVVTSW